MQRFTRITLVLAVFALLDLIGLQRPAAADNRAVFTDPTGVAIEGYDAVAYFERGQAVSGSAQHRADWNGAFWYFSSKENKAKFSADPQKYAPEFGGYCAFAWSSRGQLIAADPSMWKVVEGKLYLFQNDAARQEWARRQKKLIEDGQKKWEARVHSN